MVSFGCHRSYFAKGMDCFLCIKPVVELLEQRFQKHFWVSFAEQLEQAQKQRAGMQQTDGQGTTQNLEAMLHWMVRSQQHVVEVHDGLVPPVGAGTRNGPNSPILESGAPTSPLKQLLVFPTPRVPLVPAPATPPGGAPPSTGLVNASTESIGTGGWKQSHIHRL